MPHLLSTQQAQFRHIVQVSHDKHTGDIGQGAAIERMRSYAVRVEIVEECPDDGIWFWNVHSLVVIFHHLGSVKAPEMRPSCLKDDFVYMNRWRCSCALGNEEGLAG